ARRLPCRNRTVVVGDSAHSEGQIDRQRVGISDGTHPTDGKAPLPSRQAGRHRVGKSLLAGLNNEISECRQRKQLSWSKEIAERCQSVIGCLKVARIRRERIIGYP